MKRLDELGISPAPWHFSDGKIRSKALGTVAYYSELGKPERVIANARMLAAAPKLYERLWLSTNLIEHTIQFVSNKDIKKHLQELANENKAALAEAAGESEVAK